MESLTKDKAISAIGLKINYQEYKFVRALAPVSAHRGVILHHVGEGSFTTALAGNPGPGIHQQHIGNGWAGIGYHGIARQDGSYYQGRPYMRLGSHCPGKNDWFGLLWYGGTGDQPTPAALETLAKAIAWVAIDQGWVPSAHTVQYHGQNVATECAGNLIPYVPAIIARARTIYDAAQLGNEAPDPGHIPQPKPQRPPVTVTAGLMTVDVAGHQVEGLRYQDFAYVGVNQLTPVGVKAWHDQEADIARLERM